MKGVSLRMTPVYIECDIGTLSINPVMLSAAPQEMLRLKNNANPARSRSTAFGLLQAQQVRIPRCHKQRSSVLSELRLRSATEGLSKHPMGRASYRSLNELRLRSATEERSKLPVPERSRRAKRVSVLSGAPAAECGVLGTYFHGCAVEGRSTTEGL